MREGDRGEEQMDRREFLRRVGQTAAAVGAAAAASRLPGLAALRGAPKMAYRSLGNTGQRSSLLCFGGVMLAEANQEEADRAVEYAREHGVNHFDVGPSYGDAELRLGPALEKHRDKVFLACKTLERTRQGAEAELQASLKRLRTDHFDLYQFHALNTMEHLEAVMAPGGAWELFQEAKAKGLVKHLGVTGHQPATLLEAVKRLPLETVMCPVNFIEWEHTHAAGPLLEYAAKHQLGVIAIKAISAGQWTEKTHPYGTWYRPFDEPKQLAQALRFTLSQPVTTAAAAGDVKLLKPLIAAAEAFTPLPARAQKALLASAGAYRPLFEEAERPTAPPAPGSAAR